MNTTKNVTASLLVPGSTVLCEDGTRAVVLSNTRHRTENTVRLSNGFCERVSWFRTFVVATFSEPVLF